MMLFKVPSLSRRVLNEGLAKRFLDFYFSWAGSSKVTLPVSVCSANLPTRASFIVVCRSLPLCLVASLVEDSDYFLWRLSLTFASLLRSFFLLDSLNSLLSPMTVRLITVLSFLLKLTFIEFETVGFLVKFYGRICSKDKALCSNDKFKFLY